MQTVYDHLDCVFTDIIRVWMQRHRYLQHHHQTPSTFSPVGCGELYIAVRYILLRYLISVDDVVDEYACNDCGIDCFSVGPPICSLALVTNKLYTAVLASSEDGQVDFEGNAEFLAMPFASRKWLEETLGFATLVGSLLAQVTACNVLLGIAPHFFPEILVIYA